MNTLTIDIGGTKYMMAVFDQTGHMLQRATGATDRAGGRDWMLQQITTQARAWSTQFHFNRCGIGFGGPVHFDQQRIAMSTHVGGWSDFHLTDYLEPLLGVRPIMDNDANVGALGEAAHGAGQGFRPLFYVTLSTGIGGGLVLENGQVYRGADSWAGEIGHLTIDPSGPECLCGARGCLERMCGGLWVERDFGAPARELLRDPAFTGRYVVPLAQGLKAAVMLFNPARIVIGGGIAKAGDALFLPLRQELARQMTAWSRARLDVVPAGLGDDSVLWGALSLASSLTFS